MKQKVKREFKYRNLAEKKAVMARKCFKIYPCILNQIIGQDLRIDFRLGRTILLDYRVGLVLGIA